MERNNQPPGPSSTRRRDGGAQKLLHELEEDRYVLAGRVAAPRWLHPAFGALTALYVATPAIAGDGSRSVVGGLTTASGILLLAAYQHISGVKAPGAVGRGTVIRGLFAVLALLSTSFGLAAADLRWWISVPAAVSLGLVLIGGRRFDRRYREWLGRGV